MALGLGTTEFVILCSFGCYFKTQCYCCEQNSYSFVLWNTYKGGVVVGGVGMSWGAVAMSVLAAATGG